MKTQEVENVVVKMTGDASSYQKMINDVEKSSKAASKEVESSWEKASKSIDKFLSNTAKSIPKNLDATLGKTVSAVNSGLDSALDATSLTGTSKQTATALTFIQDTLSSLVPTLKTVAATALAVTSDIWDKLKGIGNTLASLPEMLEGVKAGFNWLRETDIGQYFKEQFAGGASIAAVSLRTLSDGFNYLTSSIKTAWTATVVFSSKYLTFSALAAGVTAGMAAARTATLSMVTIATSSITRIVASAKAAILSTAATAKAAEASVSGTGAAASFAGTSGRLMNMGKAAGIWGLAIAGAAVAIYGTWKVLTSFNKSLEESEKRIRVNTNLTMMDIEAYQEQAEAIKETANSFFLKDARDIYLKQQVGEADKELKKLSRTVDETEKVLSKISWWKKFFGTQEAKEAKAAYKEAQDEFSKYKKDKYDVGEPFVDPETEDEEFRTIQFEIDRYKYEIEDAKAKLNELQSFSFKKNWMPDYFGWFSKTKEAASDVENLQAKLEAAQKAKTELEELPDKARQIMNQRLQKATEELQKQAFLVGKTGAEALAYEAKLRGASEWRLNNLLGAEQRLKQSQGAVKFQKDWEEMLKSLKKEDELSGLTGLEHKIAALIKQGKEFNRSIPIDKLKELSNIARMHEADASRNKEIDKATALTERLKGPAAKLRDELEELSTMYRDNVGLDSETYIKALEELRKKLIEAEKATRSAYDTNTKFNTSLVGSAEAISKMEDYRNEGFGNKLGIQNSFLVNSPLRETSKDYIDVLKDIRDILKLEKEAAGIKISPTDLLFSNS